MHGCLGTVDIVGAARTGRRRGRPRLCHWRTRPSGQSLWRLPKTSTVVPCRSGSCRTAI